MASIFDRFWSIWGAKLGSKIEPRSIKNGIEKTMKKRRATRWQKSRNKKLQRPAAEGVWGPGECHVNPSLRDRYTLAHAIPSYAYVFLTAYGLKCH